MRTLAIIAIVVALCGVHGSASAGGQTACGKPAVAGELIAELRMEDGATKKYFRTPASIKEMNADYWKLMKAQGFTDAQIKAQPFATEAGALTLCGGTTDCGSKTCRTGSCYYGNVGMAGCRCS